VSPNRIVSLVPSLTELVCWLGCSDRLIGRTRFCVEPAGAIDHVPIVGGTKNPHLDRIARLAPDLVIANREENRREDVESLRAAGLTVLLTDPNSVDEAIALVRQLGVLLEAEARAETLARETAAALAAPVPRRPPRVFVPIWKQPLMALGSRTYGHDLIERCGASNVLGARARYPEVLFDEISSLAVDMVLLPDEPYPFGDADRVAFEAIAPATLVDGRLLWWYGPRMPGAIRTLRSVFGEGSR
jgi:ABC-type Fe3+-hydroxamate transport system substrate-binding protein